MINLLSIAALTIFIYMTIWFLIALYLKRNDIADVAWGLGFIVVCAVIFARGYPNFNFILILILTVLWGLRLAAHIYIRNKGKKEDYRYKAWRDEWGKWFYIRTYLQVFLLQGLFMLLISLSAIVAGSYTNETSISFINIAGLILWLIGFIFETFGDLQLSRFISDPNNKGKIMKTGLWKYTRHPNYFGEVTQWWGIFLLAVNLPYGILAVISPLTITFLILRVSGIPMLEKKYEGNTEFEEYKKVTNAFFPWFTNKKSL